MECIVNMSCGLANRMFQYSYYLYLKSLGYNVSIDYYKTAKLPHEFVDWTRIFPNAPIVQASWWKVLRLGGGSDFLSKLRRHFIPFTARIEYMPTAFTASLPVDGKDSYLFGVFQNAEMVNSVANDVRKSFVFTPLMDKRSRQLMAEMKNCESVAVHVRKGSDYLRRIWYKNTCPLSYYESAVELMMKKIKTPKFYVFTDNQMWVKQNFKWLDYKLVDVNPPVGFGCHIDMQLMSMCRHNIISNSTYSWWAAFLNESSDKVVILPRVWFNPESCDNYTSEDLLQDKWISI